MKHIISIFTLLLLLWSCAPTRVVAPLEKGEHRGGLGLGGPLIDFEGTKPVPLLSAYYANGCSEKLTYFVGGNITAGLFKNIFLDGGVTYGALSPDNWKPGISVSPNVNILYTFSGSHFRVYPDLTGNVYWKTTLGESYLGLSNWFDPQNNLSSQENGNIWVPSLNIGQKFYVKEKWIFDLEFRQLGLNVPPQSFNRIESINILENGGIGIYIGASLRF